MKSNLKKSPQAILQATEKSLDFYLSELDRYSETGFYLNPDDDSWSVAQVYMHLHDASVKYFYKVIDKCLTSPENLEGSMNENGVILMETGKNPQPKIRVMGRDEYDPARPDSIEAARELIEEMRQGARETAKKLEAATTSGKEAHPFYDFLDAWEWFHLSEVHFRHHFMQKERLDAFLATQS